MSNLKQCSPTQWRWWTRSVNTTPQMTRFRDVRVCKNWLQMKLTITEYSMTTNAQVDYKIQKERTIHLVLRMRGETERQDARHQWKRDHQDPEHLQHSAHEPQHVSDVLTKEKNNIDKIINFFMNSYWTKSRTSWSSWESLNEWKNWRSFRVPPSTPLQDRGLVEDQDTILNSLARYRNCRMK